MIGGKKIIVVLPAYNAALTLERTYREIPLDVVDEVILVDDHSKDETLEVARRLGIRHVFKHEVNKGYGANQKTCFDKALGLGADIVVMLHPDYQYDPRLIPSMCLLVASGSFQMVLGSRILGGGALKGGMPLYKYLANRVLTLVQNLLMDQKLSEYHTGYRAFDSALLNRVPFRMNSDDFVFDNQIIAQAFGAGFRIGEISCPAKYFHEASSINFRRSVQYGMGVLGVGMRYRLHRMRVLSYPILASANV